MKTLLALTLFLSFAQLSHAQENGEQTALIKESLQLAQQLKDISKEIDQGKAANEARKMAFFYAVKNKHLRYCTTGDVSLATNVVFAPPSNIGRRKACEKGYAHFFKEASAYYYFMSNYSALMFLATSLANRLKENAKKIMDIELNSVCSNESIAKDRLHLASLLSNLAQTYTVRRHSSIEVNGTKINDIGSELFSVFNQENLKHPFNQPRNYKKLSEVQAQKILGQVDLIYTVGKYFNHVMINNGGFMLAKFGEVENQIEQQLNKINLVHSRL